MSPTCLYSVHPWYCFVRHGWTHKRTHCKRSCANGNGTGVACRASGEEFVCPLATSDATFGLPCVTCFALARQAVGRRLCGAGARRSTACHSNASLGRRCGRSSGHARLQYVFASAHARDDVGGLTTSEVSVGESKRSTA